MFGKTKLIEGEISVGAQKISIRKMGTWFEYVRGDVRKLVAGDEIAIYPAPAKGYGVKLMMVRLEEELIVPPNIGVEGFFSVPIEVSVKAGDVEVDRFSIGKEKYALYGTLERGVIVRYSRSRIKEKPEGIGVMKVKIVNKGPSWGKIERIVFPLLDIMYYTKERAFYPLIEVVINRGIEVINTGKPPLKNLSAVGDELKKLSFKMRW
ncbi:hypothetical protein A3L04_09630 [Thermococcus chitonophagus]|uniref:DUF432 domain-containing protein n=1 Tax=Thermococcus chitonophagus TaxID=54262 RepID=A0A160VSU3_9EURY|nr:DUF432 domain-containing protein [Thermococcus chitonophagus]ASJ17309.1 hypothetical protein A3L04_09630 [Thermococcus chitonophagus]CUX77940.1 hypothetical protein CHITON_1161 [Thermococcus chitonophagus]